MIALLVAVGIFVVGFFMGGLYAWRVDVTLNLQRMKMLYQAKKFFRRQQYLHALECVETVLDSLHRIEGRDT